MEFDEICIIGNVVGYDIFMMVGYPILTMGIIIVACMLLTVRACSCSPRITDRLCVCLFLSLDRITIPFCLRPISDILRWS